MRWHHDRLYECILDEKVATLCFPSLLPGVSASSEMYRAFKQYLLARQSDALPPHRRIDPARAKIRAVNRGGTVSLVLAVKDGDYEYGVRKLINLVHEIFLDFLFDGRYLEYRIENFGLDLDRY
jgi:hypothetical protein